jgi:hypothetical protein
MSRWIWIQEKDKNEYPICEDCYTQEPCNHACQESSECECRVCYGEVEE